jgi:hypothetical protein
LATGDKIEYTNRRGNSIGPFLGGLTDGKAYFVITTADPEIIQLAQTRGKAMAGEALAITGDGVAVNSKTFEADVVDDNKITLLNEHGTGSGDGFSIVGSTFELGQAVRYNASDPDKAIEGLTDGAVYYVITDTHELNLSGDLRYVDSQIIGLAESENEALAGIAINLNGSQAMGEHTLTAYQVLDSGLTTGIGILANLDTTTSATGEFGIVDKSNIPKTIKLGGKEFTILTKFDLVDKGLKALYKKLTGKAEGTSNKSEGGSGSDFKAGGSLGMVVANHTVTATVGSSAILKTWKLKLKFPMPCKPVPRPELIKKHPIQQHKTAMTKKAQLSLPL